MLKSFIALTKPRILLGNLITTAGGFFLAAQGHIQWLLFLNTLLGILFVMGAACVFNNYIDRDIDALMQRTQNRPLVRGLLSPKVALIYACILGVAGFLLLYLSTNLWSFGIALFGFIVYVIVYSLWLKRRSVHAVLIGSLAGAAPPVVGYCAVTAHFDLAALSLFLILALWQMPHSYAIAIMGLSDYEKANLPALPVKKGIKVTKQYILGYMIAFVGATFLLPLLGYTGKVYAIIAALIGFVGLRLAILGFTTKDDRKWARTMLLFSIIAIVALSLTMSIDFLYH